MSLQAILLAAGSSQRFTGNKLLQPSRTSQCLLDICFELAMQLTDQVIAVIRNDEKLQKHCQQHHYPYLINMQSQTGMASSIAAGVLETRNAEGWAIFLADMPSIHPSTLRKLVQSWSDHSITAPVWRGLTGHPVIFSRKYYNALTSLQGDRGARQLLRNNPDVYSIETDDPGVCFDIDTDLDFETWLQKQSS